MKILKTSHFFKKKSTSLIISSYILKKNHAKYGYIKNEIDGQKEKKILWNRRDDDVL